MSGECELCGEHTLECRCKHSEDVLLRDLIFSSCSTVDDSIKMDLPTIISLQDTIDLIERKYGKYWRNYPHCICVVIWSSSNFLLDHVKEIVPDLFELCKEYQEKRTVNGKEFPDNFAMLAFHVIDPYTELLNE